MPAHAVLVQGLPLLLQRLDGDVLVQPIQRSLAAQCKAAACQPTSASDN